MSNLASISVLLEGIEFGGGESLLKVLVNHLADHKEEVTGDEAVCVVDAMLKHLSANSDGDRRIINLCLAALNNVTIPEKNAELFCQRAINSDGYIPNLTLHAMITEFVTHNPQLEEEGLNYYPKKGFSSDMIREDPWAYVGLVLTNIVRCESGRKLMLRQSLGFIPKLVDQIRSRNPVRRRGSVAVIRTCLFDKEIHWWMLHEVKVLTPLLMPCVVAAPFSDEEKTGMDPLLWMAAADPKKKHEPEVDILKMCVESLVLLCQHRNSREELRKRRIYPICKNLDIAQEDEAVSELILDIVNFMHRDEEEDSVEREKREKREKEAYEARLEARKHLLNTPAEVLEFWLGGDFFDEDSFTKRTQFDSRCEKWFGHKDQDFDNRQIANEALVRKAASGELDKQDEWAETPRGMLAKILLLDQFSRCCYRGTAAAFQNDYLALKLVKDILREDGGKGRAWVTYYFRPVERYWLVLVLQHSEQLQDQLDSVHFCDTILTEGATTDMLEVFREVKNTSLEHLEVIQRFGRFPGRNALLARTSTPEETAWLDSDSCPPWAKSQLPAKASVTANLESSLECMGNSAESNAEATVQSVIAKHRRDTQENSALMPSAVVDDAKDDVIGVD